MVSEYTDTNRVVYIIYRKLHPVCLSVILVFFSCRTGYGRNGNWIEQVQGKDIVKMRFISTHMYVFVSNRWMIFPKICLHIRWVLVSSQMWMSEDSKSINHDRLEQLRLIRKWGMNNRRVDERLEGG